MAGGISEAKAVGDVEGRMVHDVRQFVEQHRGVSFETFEPLEVKTQIVAGTNYFIKVKTSAAGLFHFAQRACALFH